jgi:FkbM family methyltransferase
VGFFLALVAYNAMDQTTHQLPIMTTALSPTWPPSVIHWDLQFGESLRQFALFDTMVSRAVCTEIFAGRTYPAVQFKEQVRTIVDMGANVGAAAVYFAMTYPGSSVFAFEPAPGSYALLEANTAHLPQIKSFGFGLYDCDRQAKLYCGLNDSVQNSICQSYEQRQHSEPISLREAAAVLRELAIETIDILKLDTEGCEVPILHSLAPWIPTISVIYVEFHSEVDRLVIDRLLSPTHYLWRGEIKRFCRGELTYLAKACLHPDEERFQSLRP